jgi:hypothetical protein
MRQAIERLLNGNIEFNFVLENTRSCNHPSSTNHEFACDFSDLEPQWRDLFTMLFSNSGWSYEKFAQKLLS